MIAGVVTASVSLAILAVGLSVKALNKQAKKDENTEKK